MIVQYGSYSFEDGECSMVNFRAMPVRTSMGLKRSVKIRMDCAGEFIFQGAVDQDAIKAKIAAAKAALDEDYQDLTLLHNDGTTPSPFKLENGNAANMTGNLVTHVQAEFINPSLTLIDFQQGISIRGTAGPVNRWERRVGSQWQRKTVSQSSTKIIRQSGRSIGFGTYLPAPLPLLSSFYEHEELRVVEYVGPSLFYRRPEFYETRWTYVFETPFAFTPTVSYPVIF
jgi:hypothetical protein